MTLPLSVYKIKKMRVFFPQVQLTEHIKFGDMVYKVDHAKLRCGDEEACQPIRRISHAEVITSYLFFTAFAVMFSVNFIVILS